MSRAGFTLPRLYAILDAQTLEVRGLDLIRTALELRAARVELIQYRDKAGDLASVERQAFRLSASLSGTGCRLILNDYPKLATACGFDGVHVGQGDTEPALAREIIGPELILGVSTHTAAQVELADGSAADYIAIGPVFTSGSKVDHEPKVGLRGVEQARALTRKPLVAIGGISLSNARSVLDAGADGIAVIGAFFQPNRTVEENARELERTSKTWRTARLDTPG